MKLRLAGAGAAPPSKDEIALISEATYPFPYPFPFPKQTRERVRERERERRFAMTHQGLDNENQASLVGQLGTVAVRVGPSSA
jgi:hypothetical protein